MMTEKETFCATWALNALSFDLIDDRMFRKSFNPSIPVGFNKYAMFLPHPLFFCHFSGKNYPGKWLTLLGAFANGLLSA
jgi:hypothetical protein